MLLVQDAKVMFLDETVAGMSTDEREQTGELLQRIMGDRTIVVIEHDMDFMRTYADVVTVMHAGKVLARSEEHTSELQSLMRISYAVFCLKKNNATRPHIHKSANR